MIDSRLYDLSQPLSSDAAFLEKLGPISSSLLLQHPASLVQVTRYKLTTHTGTHLDAPRHFFCDDPSIDQMPASRFAGKAFAGKAVVVETKEHAFEETTLDVASWSNKVNSSIETCSLLTATNDRVVFDYIKSLAKTTGSTFSIEVVFKRYDI